MSQFKRAQATLLPSENKSFIYRRNDLDLLYLGDFELCTNLSIRTNQHIYISSDEGIKEGEPYIENYKYVSDGSVKPVADRYNRKIIAATDTSLKIKTSVTAFSGERIRVFHGTELLAQPSQQFIERFCAAYNKKEPITDVMIEYENKFIGKEYVDDQDAFGYDIFEQVLKVNPKDNTITIKKLKNNWDRNEMVATLNLYREYVWKNGATQMDLNEWIKQNL